MVALDALDAAVAAVGAAAGGRTDIDRLTFTCPTDHKLLDQGWTTRKNPDGTTAWIPHPNWPLTGGTDEFHHPKRLLPEDDG